MRSPCCSPDAQHEAQAGPTVEIVAAAEPRPADGMGLIAKGSFLMGSEDRWAYPADGEGPVREISLDSFRIDPVAVSNGAFASFIAAPLITGRDDHAVRPKERCGSPPHGGLPRPLAQTPASLGGCSSSPNTRIP